MGIRWAEFLLNPSSIFDQANATQPLSECFDERTVIRVGRRADRSECKPDYAAESPNAAEPQTTNLCPCCGGRMIIIERFERGATPHYRASPPMSAVRIDTS